MGARKSKGAPAVSNAAPPDPKHAAAHQATIEVRRDGGCVCATVSDDGAGFDPAVVAGSRSGHLGLDGMRTRAERFGGQVEIDSAPGSGTRLRVRMPVHGHEAGNVAREVAES